MNLIRPVRDAHGNDCGGGWKNSWKPMVMLWTRNVTADQQTSLVDWSDAEISRAYIAE